MTQARDLDDAECIASVGDYVMFRETPRAYRYRVEFCVMSPNEHADEMAHPARWPNWRTWCRIEKLNAA